MFLDDYAPYPFRVDRQPADVAVDRYLDYQIESPEHWWEEMAASMDGLGLRRLGADQVVRLRDEVLREVQRFGETNQLLVEVPVHIAVGRKT